MTRTLEQLDAAVAKIETALGDMDKTIDEWRSVRPPLLPNGFYNIWKSMAQLFDSENSLNAAVLKLQGGAPPTPTTSTSPTPPAPTPNPAPSANTIPPLSAATIATVIAAFENNIRHAWNTAFAARVKSELLAGVYTLNDTAFINGVNDFYYSQGLQANAAYRNAVNAYIGIIEQRDANGVPYPAGDPRIKQVSGSVSPTPNPAPTPSPSPAPVPVPPGSFAAQVVAALASLKVYITPNGVGFGIPPDPNSQSAIHVGGLWAAEITGISNTQKSDGQNPNEIHKNSLVVADNDGGMRARQYSTYKPGGGGEVRNTTNRVQTTFHFMDSYGNVCISDSRYPNKQFFYLVKHDNGDVDLCNYLKGAHIRLLESVAQYGATDKQVAP